MNMYHGETEGMREGEKMGGGGTCILKELPK